MLKSVFLSVLVIVVLAVLYFVPLDLSIAKYTIKLPLEYLTSAGISSDKITLQQLHIISIKNARINLQKMTIVADDIFLYLRFNKIIASTVPLYIRINNMYFKRAQGGHEKYFPLAISFLDDARFEKAYGEFKISLLGLDIDNLYMYGDNVILKAQGNISLRQALDINLDIKLSNPQQFQQGFDVLSGSRMSMSIKGTFKKPTLSISNLAIMVR